MENEGYNKAIELVHLCDSPDGFLASPTDQANYRRIWARDGVIIGLAALLSGDTELIKTFKQTLETLALYQGPHGEIPSNVDTLTKRISYGGTTGRIDSDLWFIIGCGEYWQATGDNEFIERMMPVIERVRFLLGAWEYNNRGLLYVPQAGDWADEYLHAGYILYDQVLYYQAQKTICHIHAHIHGTMDHALVEKTTHLKHLIRTNYWFDHKDEDDGDIYHRVLYNKGEKAAPHRQGKYCYWMPSFSPIGYSYRFDAFANVLVSLFDIADDEQRECVNRFINDTVHDDMPLIPAFLPVIQPMDRDWEELQMTFSYTFKNKPFEYHNGGLWPMLTGFYVADLVKHGEIQLAKKFLKAIHNANALIMDDKEWSFPEFVHGQRFTSGGTFNQGWSAAAAVIGEHTLNNQTLFRIHE